MVLFEIFLGQNLIQMYTKTHQIAQLKKMSRGSMPPNPTSKFVTCKFPNVKKKILPPPLPNPGDSPAKTLVNRYK